MIYSISSLGASSHSNGNIGNVSLFRSSASRMSLPCLPELGVRQVTVARPWLVATQHCVPYLGQRQLRGEQRIVPAPPQLHCSTGHNITIKQLPCPCPSTARCPDCCSNTSLKGVQQTAACAMQFTAACVRNGLDTCGEHCATNKYCQAAVTACL